MPLGTGADAAVFCPRKSLGVPDGGAVLVTEGTSRAARPASGEGRGPIGGLAAGGTGCALRPCGDPGAGGGGAGQGQQGRRRGRRGPAHRGGDRRVGDGGGRRGAGCQPPVTADRADRRHARRRRRRGHPRPPPGQLRGPGRRPRPAVPRAVPGPAAGGVPALLPGAGGRPLRGHRRAPPARRAGHRDLAGGPSAARPEPLRRARPAAAGAAGPARAPGPGPWHVDLVADAASRVLRP